jgi:hypothetical protein
MLITDIGHNNVEEINLGMAEVTMAGQSGRALL